MFDPELALLTSQLVIHDQREDRSLLRLFADQFGELFDLAHYVLRKGRIVVAVMILQLFVSAKCLVEPAEMIAVLVGSIEASNVRSLMVW